ncbi:hypothetical protein AWC25_15280 [Mycobacterium sherrisii]|uniref:Steroid 5-alpha reductase C-terminal domain-containing protein n=1 Tax=Mycobacterium sherrisii TaxID=243061 RepID=A0A1E3T5J5_9MYCO|nr:hypothetical protein [Mycobacterium sherrisii]ODR09739.1 hypothetical protein BHQ21_03890 [Mycobacterium sherrisii]ORW75034.1 hypothetical protein AWC25_15280 [Mycobacterium sherrisii]
MLIILGQAVVYRSPGLVVYAAIVWIAFATFVRLYEQPTLTRQNGDEYEEYKLNVPVWLPRLRPR